MYDTTAYAKVNKEEGFDTIKCEDRFSDMNGKEEHAPMSNYGNLVGTPSMDNHVADMSTSIMQSDQDELPIRDKLLKDTHKHR